MDIGQKIYDLRRARGLTQAQLAKMVGVSEAAIRAYETGRRRPKQAHLERIAAALEIRPEAIADYGIESADEVIHLLFRLERRWKLRPEEVVDGHFFLESSDGDVFAAVHAWGEMRSRLDAGEITVEEYELWQDTYTSKKYVG